MFEDSTFESAGRIHTRSRGWSLAALAFNALILAALIVIPLIYPEALPQRLINTLLTAPPQASAEPKPVPQQPQAQAFQNDHQFIGINLAAPRLIPRINPEDSGPAHDSNIGQMVSIGNGDTVPGGDVFAHDGSSTPRVVAEHKGPVTISQGVAEGMLIRKVVPRYPPIALAAHAQGTVTLQALISREGTIENLHVVSGSPMLQQAALEAVSQWRYRPYLLSGQPVDVETTINVVFSLNQ